MSHINTFAIRKVLDIDTKEFEYELEGLIHSLQTSPELKDLEATANCLTLMKRISYHYCMGHASAYCHTSRLIYNLEPLLIRYMSKSDNPVKVGIIKLNNILNKAAGLNYYDPPTDIAIGGEEIMVHIGSKYFHHLLHVNYTEDDIKTMKRNLAAPVSCGLKSITSEKVINAIKSEVDKFHYKDNEQIIKAGSFRKLLHTLNKTQNSLPNQFAEQRADVLAKVRNSIAHTGNMDLKGTSLINVISSASLYLNTASKRRIKPKMRFLNAIRNYITCPFLAFLEIAEHFKILIHICVILILIWILSPTPMPQRIHYSYVSFCDKQEELFEAFAKKDAETVLKIHKETNIIMETLDAIE